MKVLLFRPKPHKETIGLQNVMICEPLELEYISSNIEALGHKCIIVDMILERHSVSWFVERLKPDVVGITGYISHVNIIKDCSIPITTCIAMIIISKKVYFLLLGLLSQSLSIIGAILVCIFVYIGLNYYFSRFNDMNLNKILQ